MTEACTAADVRLINWDNYTFVANVFVTRTEWRATLDVPGPRSDGISFSGSGPDFSPGSFGATTRSGDPPTPGNTNRTTAMLIQSSWRGVSLIAQPGYQAVSDIR
jgi:hypothetical protein